MLALEELLRDLAREQIRSGSEGASTVAAAFMGSGAVSKLREIRDELLRKVDSISVEFVTDLRDSRGERTSGLAAIPGDWMKIDAGLPADRMRTVMFHELVHACGGTELDSEVLEHLYGQAFGNDTDSPPDDDDLTNFATNGGKWFDWDAGRRIALFNGFPLNFPPS